MCNVVNLAGSISCFVMNVSGNLMVSVSRDGCMKLWDVFSGTLIDSTVNLNMTMLAEMTFLGPSKAAKSATIVNNSCDSGCNWSGFWRDLRLGCVRF